MIERRLDRALRDLVEHHAMRRFRRTLRNDLFLQMLADRFAFAIRVGGQIDRVSFFRRFLQFRDDPLVVAFLRIGDQFVSGFEIVVDVYTEAFRGQIFDMADRGLNE